MKKFISAILLLAVILSSCSCGAQPKIKEDISPAQKTGEMQIHFIDVGQGDCILIKSENTSMLIDTGTAENNTVIEKYLRNQGIDRLDYFIGTHPHADHLGAAWAAVKKFNPKTVFMTGEMSSSYFYEKLLDALIEEKINITVPDIGCVYREKDFDFKFISPSHDYGNSNDNSLVTVIKHKNIKVILMGDAEKDVENDLLKNYTDLSADVLKVGHHGSRYGSSYDFLRAVSPTVAVIQSGKGNSYNHPHEEALKRLNDIGANVLRCDESGTIVITSDGDRIYCKSEALNKKEVPKIKYIGNKKSLKFHRDTCKGLPDGKNAVIFTSREEAVNMGYSPCGNCNP